MRIKIKSADSGVLNPKSYTTEELVTFLYESVRKLQFDPLRLSRTAAYEELRRRLWAAPATQVSPTVVIEGSWHDKHLHPLGGA